MDRDELERLCRAAKAALMTYPGVVGVGCGARERAGVVTDQVALRVYVSAKKPLAELRPQDVTPRGYSAILRIGTDVVERRGLGVACSSTPNIFPGDEIARDIDVNAIEQHGTIGLIVTKSDGGQTKRLILTNAHVLEDSGAATNSDIYKPHKTQCNKPIGTVLSGADFTKKSLTFPYSASPGILCTIDAALANINVGVKSGNINTHITKEIPQFGPGLRNLLAEWSIKPVTTLQEARDLNATVAAKKFEVRKFGATTGFTRGLIVGICLPQPDVAQPVSSADFTFVLAIEAHPSETPNTSTYILDISEIDPGLGIPARFADQFVATSKVTLTTSGQKITLAGPFFSNLGDSGSIILDTNGQIVGMLQHTGGIETNHKEFVRFGVDYAQLIFPAFEAMKLAPNAVVPPGAPQAGAGMDEAQEPPESMEQRVLDAAEGAFGRTAAGRRLLRLARMHLPEIQSLLHHRRRAMVAWHRNKGPAYIAAIAGAMRHPGRPVPAEIDGVRLGEAIRHIRHILFLEGSAALRESLEEHSDWLISLIERATSPEQALRILLGNDERRPASDPACLRIVNARGVPGTASAVVRCRDGALKFLTSHHVLFGSGAVAGDKVFAVDEGDGRMCMMKIGTAERGHIGRVMHGGTPVFVDCAIGTFIDPKKLPPSLQDRLCNVAQISIIEDAEIGALVSKDGAATGRTTGRIVDVAYPDLPFVNGRRYDAPGQLLVKPLFAAGLSPEVAVNFCTAGDSGAAVFNDDGRIVGLLWGANANGEGIACPIQPVMKVLELEPATDLSQHSPTLALHP